MVGETDRILVPFDGDGAGEEELSWGQLDLWSAMDRLGTWLPIGFVAPLPSGTTVSTVTTELRFLMSRYQSMRTRLRFGAADGLPRQVVSASGEVPLEIVEAPDGTEPAKVAAEVEQRFRESAYDFSTDWPVRTAVIRHQGQLTHQVMVTCHLTTDAAGGQTVAEDLASRDPATGETARPVAVMQPMAQAHWQRTPAGQRQSRAAVRYTERTLRTMPPVRFGNSTDPRRPRYWQLGFRSPAMHLAVRATADRAAAASTPVLLTAFLVALARVSGVNPAVTRVLVGNRFRPDLADVVAPISQAGLLLVDLAGAAASGTAGGGTGITVDEALTRTRSRALSAYKYAYYDPRQMAGLEERVSAQRGERVEVGCFVNDRRIRTRDSLGDNGGEPTPLPRAEVEAARAQTTLRCELQQDEPLEQLFLHINDVPDILDLTLLIDTHYISPSDAEALLRQLEQVAFELAFDPTTPALPDSAAATPDGAR